MIRKLLILLVRIYQYTLSPFVGNQCRFYPTCSEYAIEALKKRGAFIGSWLTLKRLVKCHPWHPGGIDFVNAPESSVPDQDRADRNRDN